MKGGERLGNETTTIDTKGSVPKGIETIGLGGGVGTHGNEPHEIET